MHIYGDNEIIYEVLELNGNFRINKSFIGNEHFMFNVIQVFISFFLF